MNYLIKLNANQDDISDLFVQILSLNEEMINKLFEKILIMQHKFYSKIKNCPKRSKQPQFLKTAR